MDGDRFLRVVEVLMDLVDGDRLKVFRQYIFQTNSIQRVQQIDLILDPKEDDVICIYVRCLHIKSGLCLMIISNLHNIFQKIAKMNNFLFGQNNNQYIEASYAPSARAKCKRCKDTIEKGTLRLGQIMEDDHFNARYYYHLNCFRLPPRFKTIDPTTQIYKLDQLEAKDIDRVIAIMDQEVSRVNEGKKIKKQASTTKRGKPKEDKPKKISQQQQPQEGRRMTRGRARANLDKEPSPAKQSVRSRKSTKTKQSGRSASKSAKQVQKADKQGKSASKSKRSQSVKGKAKAKKTRKVTVSGGYTAAQKEQFKELMQKYLQKTADELKNILGANSQPRTGNKRQLAERCADGKLLGKIPMCTSCGGGKLRFNRDTGIYVCPGFMDDDEFKNCNKRFTMFQIARDPWIEP